jgi:peroxiredoxin
MRALVLACLVTLAPFAGCLGDGSPDAGAPLSPPEDPSAVGPDWSFVDTDGATHSRDAPAANATLVFFMASWCSTCRSKAPLLREVHDAYAERGVRMYSVSWDRTDDDGSLEAWKERYAQPWPHGIDPSFEIQRTFGITAQSSAVVLDARGNLVQKWGYGQLDGEGLRAALDAALARTSA